MSDAQVRVRYAVGAGGWIRVRALRQGSSGSTEGFVRVALGDDGRLRIVAVVLESFTVRKGRREPLQGADLRGFPLATVEGEANGPLRDQILAGLDRPMALRLVGDGEPPGTPRRAPNPRTDLRLDVPTSRPYPDKFWEQVARRYVDALRFGGNRPAALIAEANDVNVKAVHRWVAEARKRGHLAPGTAGRAG